MASPAQVTTRRLQRSHNSIIRAACRTPTRQNESIFTPQFRHRHLHHYQKHLSICPSACPKPIPSSQIGQPLLSRPWPTSTQFSTITSARIVPRLSTSNISFQCRHYTSTRKAVDGVSEQVGSSSPKPPTLLGQLTPRPHENIYTLPNFLTFTRLLAAPAVGYFILTSQPLYALSLFFYAGITDAVDGYLARRYNSQTVVGTVIDPMADKALMTITVVCLAIQGSIPVWLAVIILGRDIGLAISAIYFRWISLPPPKTMARYWDFSLPSAEVHPTEISKINTLLQLLLIGNAMVLPVLPEMWVEWGNLRGIFEGWQVLVASTTVWSGLSYVWSKDAVKILTKEEIGRKMEEMGVEKEKIQEEKNNVPGSKDEKVV